MLNETGKRKVVDLYAKITVMLKQGDKFFRYELENLFRVEIFEVDILRRIEDKRGREREGYREWEKEREIRWMRE